MTYWDIQGKLPVAILLNMEVVRDAAVLLISATII